jgi:hypothetical protein
VRPALLAFWALVLWGTLLLGAAVVDAPAQGVRAVLARLVPAHGASVWARANALTVALAIVVWLLLAGLFAWKRRAAQRDVA